MSTAEQPVRKSTFEDGESYDLLCESLDYGRAFYGELARSANGPILDVACGTGRLLIPFLKEGLDVEGLDLFEPMLARLRTKAAACGLHPRVHRSDMSQFKLDRQFALVMIPFNAFVHNMTADAQLGCLHSCRDHLRAGGLLAFDSYFPSPEIILAPNGQRWFEGEVSHPKTGLPLRCYDTRTFDLVAQVQHSINEIEFLDAAGNVTATVASESAARWIYKCEMELLMRLSGFARWEICGGFDRRPLHQANDSMVVLAWK